MDLINLISHYLLRFTTSSKASRLATCARSIGRVRKVGNRIITITKKSGYNLGIVWYGWLIEDIIKYNFKIPNPDSSNKG